MLSFPRDLYVEIPGRGYDKINAAYPYGGAALVRRDGGPAHRPADPPLHRGRLRRLLVRWSPSSAACTTPSTGATTTHGAAGWQSIDLEPGYQLLRGHDALDFVRFRHDRLGDFSRIRRQQTFLKELQRQSGRWNKDWKRVAKLLTAMHEEHDVRPRLAQDPAAARQSGAHARHEQRAHGAHRGVDADDGRRSRTWSPRASEVQAAVAEFSDPTRAPVAEKGGVMAEAGLHGPRPQRQRRARHRGRGGRTAAPIGLPGRGGRQRRRVHLRDLRRLRAGGHEATPPQQFVRLLSPAELRLLPRAPGQTRRHHGRDRLELRRHDRRARAADGGGPRSLTTDGALRRGRLAGARRQTPIKLQMPGVWAPGLAYDEFRAYRIETPDGPAGRRPPWPSDVTPRSGYFSIQVTRWLDPPAIAHPTAQKTIAARRTCCSTTARDLHMVAWRRGNACTGCSTPSTTSFPPTS